MSDFISLAITALIQLIVFSLIPFVWWLITDRKTSLFQWIGIKKPIYNDSKIKTWIIIILVSVLYVGVMFLVMTTLLEDVPTATSQLSGKGFFAIPSVLVYAIIQTSLSEELFFRGFLCKRLLKRFGFIIGNTVQSILFGLLHGIPFGLATGKGLVCILLTILPAAIGFLQGWLNEKKANGSIIPSWSLHALMNIFSALSMI